MAAFSILSCVLFALQILNIYCQKFPSPPTISGSYRAMGEMTEALPDDKKTIIQVAFEENFDPKNQRSSFTIWESGYNVSFLENFRTNQTLKYDQKSGCDIVSVTDWINIDAPPSLLGFGNESRIRFTLQKLFSVYDTKIKDYKGNVTFRNIAAKKWTHQIKSVVDGNEVTVTMHSYWSDSTWNTTSGEDTIPLGFVIYKMVEKKDGQILVAWQNINVFGFIPDVVSPDAFKPREGQYCEGAINEIPAVSIPKLDAISIHSELALADYLEIKTVDTWYDMKNKLLKINMDRIAGQEPSYLKPGRKFSSEITSQMLMATFELTGYQSKLSCEVTPITDYEFEAQDIINPKLQATEWDMDHFFGVNSTNYTYIGETSKRNIPCHIFQGKRTDWPEKTSGTTSLWEWCIAANLTADNPAVNFRPGEIPIISLQIFMLKSTDPDFPVNSRIVHHFYDVMSENSASMYATEFDVSLCFADDEKRNLQFTVDVKIDESNLMILENATADIQFLSLWQDQILSASNLTLQSLRINKVKSTIYNNVLYVMFTLLGPHKQLPSFTSLKSLDQAEKDIKTAIDNSKFNIRYVYSFGKALNLNATPKTLMPQVDPTVIPDGTTVNPLQTTKSTASRTGSTPTFGTGSTPTLGTGSTPTLGTGSTPTGKTHGTGSTTTGIPTTTGKEDITSDIKLGHSSGTVAAVTIIMLIAGISVGAGGTFYKYKGLPNCLRRA